MTPTDFKEWRAALGFTQTQAAERLEISRGTVENFERGRRRDDGKPVAIPASIVALCDHVAIEEAAVRNDIAILRGETRARVDRLAELVRKSGLIGPA